MTASQLPEDSKWIVRKLHKAVLQQLCELGVTRERVDHMLREFVERRAQQLFMNSVTDIVTRFLINRWASATPAFEKASKEAWEAAARKVIEDRFAAGLNVTVTFSNK